MGAVSATMVRALRDRTGLGMMECRKALIATGGNIELAIEEMRKNSGMKASRKAARTAAEGIIAARIADDNSYAVMVEVNSETDFAARDADFLAFVDKVADKVFNAKTTDISLISAEMDTEREGLVQKIGENIAIRRAVLIEGLNVNAYVHNNNKFGALVSITGGDARLAKDIAMHVTAVNPLVITPDDMPSGELSKEREIIRAQPDMAGKSDTIMEKMMTGRINKFLAENSLVEQPFVKNPEKKVGSLVKDAGAEISKFLRLAVGDGIEIAQSDFATEVSAQLRG